MTWLLFLSLLAGPALAAGPNAATEPTDPPASSDFQLESERPESGVYHLWASETFDGRADALLAILSASRCREGCDFAVDHVSIDETLARSETPRGWRNVTWTYIDSLIDASYFNLTEVVFDEERTVRRFGTAPPDVIERWQSPHDPLFHQQGGTWTLTEVFDAAGRFLHTRVEVEMGMRSDRFLVNLLPGRVLKGAGDHLRTIFGQMRELEEHRLSPAR